MENSKGLGAILAFIAMIIVGVLATPFILILLFLGSTQEANACPPQGGDVNVSQGQSDATPPPAGEKGEDGRPAPFYGSVDGESSVTGGLIPAEWEQDVVNASKTSGIPTSWIAAQLESESRWNAGLGHNHAGAAGLAQFTDATWATYGHGASQSDPKDSGNG